MPISLQPLSILSPGINGFSKSNNLAPLEKAFALQPDVFSKAADQVVLGNSGISHLTKGLNPLSGMPTHSAAELKEVSKNFESIFMQMLFKEMRNSVEKSNLLGNSQGMEFFESMYDSGLTQKLASSGGLGIGHMVYEKLKGATLPHQKTFQ